MNIVKKMSIFFAVLFTFMCLNIGVFAAGNVVFLDVTDPKEDLQYVRMSDGSAFDFSKYPTSGVQDPEFIAMHEYGFSKDPDNASDYALYFYIYTGSPNFLKFALSVLNGQDEDLFKRGIFTLSMKVAYFDTVSDTEKELKIDNYGLKYITSSQDGYFAKFKLELTDESSVYKFLSNVDQRSYTVKGVNILLRNVSDPNDAVSTLGVNEKYVFSGEQASMTVLHSDIDEISSYVHGTYYRTVSSPKGEGYQNDIFSVYFSVPDEYFEQFDAMTAIKCGWRECLSDWLFFTEDTSVYDELESVFAGSDYSPVVTTKNTKYPALAFGNVRSEAGWPYTDVSVFKADYSWNMDVTKVNHSINNKLNVIPNNLYYVDDITDFFYRFGSDERDEMKMQQVGDWKEYIFRDTDVLDIESRYQNDRWEQFWDGYIFGFEEEEMDRQVNPFFIVTDEDVAGYNKGSDNTKICRDLLINEYGIDNFIEFYNDENSNDRTVILFRFALRDYYATSCNYYPIGSAIEYYSMVAAQMTVIKDFEIIWLEFTKDSVAHIFPFNQVNGPIDIYPDASNPNSPLNVTLKTIGDGVDSMLNSLFKALSLILVCIIILVFWKPITWIFGKIFDFFKWVYRKVTKRE